MRRLVIRPLQCGGAETSDRLSLQHYIQVDLQGDVLGMSGVIPIKLLQAGPAWLMHDYSNRDNCSPLSTMQLCSLRCSARLAYISLVQYPQSQPGPDGIHHSRACLVHACGFLACGMAAYAAMGSALYGDRTCWRHPGRQYRPQYSSLAFGNKLPGQSVE